MPPSGLLDLLIRESNMKIAQLTEAYESELSKLQALIFQKASWEKERDDLIILLTGVAPNITPPVGIQIRGLPPSTIGGMRSVIIPTAIIKVAPQLVSYDLISAPVGSVATNIPKVFAIISAHQPVPRGILIPTNPPAIGCWIQTTSINTPEAYNSSIDYFMCFENLIDAVAANGGGRPIILCADWGTKAPGMIRKIEDNHDKVCAVFWDYESQINVVDLLNVRSCAHSYGLSLGVGGSPQPDDSLAFPYQGFIYSDASKYCDFVAPQFYSQWFSNKPSKIKTLYDGVMAASTVPVIPLLTVEVSTTNPAISKYNPLTPTIINAVYGPLAMPSVACWNVANMDALQWSAVESVLT